jgi:transcriptional regulator with XRE-family HTH domain
MWMQHHDQSRFHDLRPYTHGMGRKLKKTRPPQAARLVALRKAAGLSQAELARLIGEPQANIAFWERTEKPPRSDVLPKLADVLGVRIEELLDVQAPAGRRAPAASQARRLFDEVQKLPRRQQQKVLDVVSAIVEQFKRKAS